MNVEIIYLVKDSKEFKVEVPLNEQFLHSRQKFNEMVLSFIKEDLIEKIHAFRIKFSEDFQGEKSILPSWLKSIDKKTIQKDKF